MKRVLVGLAAALALVLCLSACRGRGANGANQATENTQLSIYNQSQPLPLFNKSQLRQTLIEIETAQAKPTPTTTFFFNLGSVDPISSCPSIGFPVATTDQISNPEQLARTGGTNNVSGVIPQLDPNGIYSGDSTGTYVLCLNNQGQTYAAYWEGFVYAVSGGASWDATTHSITNVTNPTGAFSRLDPSSIRREGNSSPSTTVKP